MKNKRNASPNSLKNMGYNATSFKAGEERTREAGRKGATSEKRKETIRFKEAMQSLFEQKKVGSDGKEYTGAQMLAMKTFKKALDGDTNALKIALEYAEGKPEETVKVNVSENLEEKLDKLSADTIKAMIDKKTEEEE